MMISSFTSLPQTSLTLPSSLLGLRECIGCNQTNLGSRSIISSELSWTFYLLFYIHSDASKEGIFRIPGNSERQRRLKARLNEGRLVDLHNEEFTAHDVACVLKTYLGELPEPLLTEKHYVAHVQAASRFFNATIWCNCWQNVVHETTIKRVTTTILLFHPGTKCGGNINQHFTDLMTSHLDTISNLQPDQLPTFLLYSFNYVLLVMYLIISHVAYLRRHIYPRD